MLMSIKNLGLSVNAHDGDEEYQSRRKADDVFHDHFSSLYLRFEDRGLSEAKDWALARPVATRVSSRRAGSSAGAESNRLSQSFIRPRIWSRRTVRSRTSASSSSSFAAASSRT